MWSAGVDIIFLPRQTQMHVDKRGEDKETRLCPHDTRGFSSLELMSENTAEAFPGSIIAAEKLTKSFEGSGLNHRGGMARKAKQKAQL